MARSSFSGSIRNKLFGISAVEVTASKHPLFIFLSIKFFIRPFSCTVSFLISLLPLLILFLLLHPLRIFLRLLLPFVSSVLLHASPFSFSVIRICADGRHKYCVINIPVSFYVFLPLSPTCWSEMLTVLRESFVL